MFDAAIPPAIAREAGILLGRIHGNVLCPILPRLRSNRRAGGRPRQFPRRNRFPNDCEDNVLAGTGTVGGFRNGEAVGVIGATHFACQSAAEIFVERFSVEPGRIGVLHKTSPRGNGSGDAMPTVALRPSFFSISCTASATARTVAS